MRPGARLDETRDRAQQRRLPGARRSDQRDRRLDVERQLEVERPKRDDEPVDGERCHESPMRSVTSRSDAEQDEHAAHRERRVEASVELGVDRERQRLGHTLEAAREHDRGAELAEPARERQREAGDQAAARQRQHDAEERAPGPRAERARGGGEIRVGGFERGDRLADVERARDIGDRDRDRALGERQRDPEASRLEPSRPKRPNAASSPMPATAGGSTSGSSTSVTASERPRKRRRRRAGRRSASRTARISSCAIRLVFRLTHERISDDRVRELVDQAPGRRVDEDRDDRQKQEGQRDERREPSRRRARSSAAPRHALLLLRAA